MRLTETQIELIRQTVADLAGADASVRVFGSRVVDSARGGDVDLLVELPMPVEAPALLAARVGARISRGMHGRQVDVLLSAPNLQECDVHRFARKNGVRL